MNRFYAVVVLLMGMQSGMQITSNIWNPEPEKIPFAIMYFLIACLFIYRMKEPKEEPKEEPKKDDDVVSE